MTVPLVVSGVSFDFPEFNDEDYADQVVGWASAVTSAILPKAGGSWSLTGEVDLGSGFSFKASYFKSRTASPATAGFIRLAKTDVLSWKSNDGTSNIDLDVSADVLRWAGNPILTLALGAADTTLRMNAGGTAYEWAKLTTANLDAAAGIVDTQLATISTAGKVSNSATTAASANTPSAIVARDGSGNFTAGTITANLTGNVTGNVTGNTSGTAASVTGVTPADHGGTGVANNTAATTTRVGNFAKTERLTAATDVTYPTTGTLATLAGTEAFTSKTLTSAVISNYLNFTQTSAPPGPAAGTISLYAKTDGKLYTKDSAFTETQVGSGGGSKNYVQLPSTYTAAASSSVVGWYFSGSGTISTITSSIPRLTTTGTAIQFVSNANGDYIRYRFALDDADISKKLLFSFAQIVAASGDFKVEAYSGTVSSCTTRLTLSTDDATPATLLPALTGVFETTFDCTTATHYEIRFVATGASKTLKISDVLVSPDKRSVSGNVGNGPWISAAPTFTNLTLGNGTATSSYRREGDSMRLLTNVVFGSTTSVGGSILIGLPSGFTIDITGLPASGLNQVVGKAFAINAAANSRNASDVIYNSTTRCSIQGGSRDSTAWNASQPFGVAWATGDTLSTEMLVPIAEWAGGTVNLAQNDVQYVSTADGVTSVYGPAGALVPSITASTVATTTSYNITVPYSMQATDSLSVEVQLAGVGPWVPVSTAGGLGYSTYSKQNTGAAVRIYGIGAYATSSTVVRVDFGNAGAAPTGTTYGAVGSNYPGTALDRYRVVIAKSGQAVGFGEVVPGTSAGLVSKNGLKGRTDGNTVPAGYVGETKTSAGSATAYTSTQYMDGGNGGLTLTPGVWLIKGLYSYVPSSDSAITQIAYGVGTAPGNSTSGSVEGFVVVKNASYTPSGTAQFVGSPGYVNISVSTIYYPKFAVTGIRSGGTVSSDLFAVRIA